jgi:hypothetical protein
MHRPAPHRPGETQGPGPLTPLERRVLARALAGDGPELAPLREQLARATVLSRTHSGVGFVTRLAVPPELPAAPEGAARQVRPVHAAHPALGDPAEFLVQVRDGRLAVLEAFCFDGAWPGDESAFQVPG